MTMFNGHLVLARFSLLSQTSTTIIIIILHICIVKPRLLLLTESFLLSHHENVHALLTSSTPSDRSLGSVITRMSLI
jgi:hypothetical protein